MSPRCKRSLSQLVARHEALRTTFVVVDGAPRQVISEALPLAMEVSDLRTVERSQRESELERCIREEAQRPFDLSAGPVIRAALFRIGDQERIFVLTLHHIASDGPSMAIFFEELALFYEGFVKGMAVDVPELRAQYADFAVWQREELVPQIREAQLAYWKEQLRDCPAALDFSSDRSRSGSASFRGEMEYRDLPRQLSEDFRSLTQRQDGTRFMALLALFQVLLSRFTGQEDVSVGCPMTHRNRAEGSRVIGFFVNMVALRCRLEGNPTFRELLPSIREVVLGAYAHQDLPFEQLVAELQPERVPGRNPFFQAMQEPAWRQLAISGAQCTLFQRAARRLRNLLHGVVDDPDCKVFDLPLISSKQREELLLKWNNTREDYPNPDCAHRLFEAQVEKTPDAVAVKFQAQQLTYQDLNSRANQLARYLVSLGAGAEVLIGVCLERSLDLVITLLAVMKSGAAYLPLDPSHPTERREAILQDSGAKILITGQTVSQNMHTAVGCVVLLLEHVSASQQSAANLAVVVRPNDLAYVIYTSGSTGQPKGVQVEHGSVTNFLLTMRKLPGLAREDILLAVTTVAFDIAGLELWLPLTVGALVIIASRDEVTDAYRLMDILEESKVTVMQATPATWRMLLATGWTGNQRLKVLCGGESLSGRVADELVARCGSVWNMYGPTESTIWSSVHQAKAGGTAVVPIGRPIGNTTMYVLGRNMQPVPIGVRGELYIGGAGVARGYLGAPQLTAERFVADPFSTEADSRLYRTGDSVRQRRDGTLEFLERMDRQTKIRGSRVEPAEIESVLGQYPGLQQAAVMVRDHSGEKQLVAYVVLSNKPHERARQPDATRGAQSAPATLNGNLVQTELTRFLREKLPNYMLPSAFVVPDALPVAPSGKLDWKAFPVPEHRVEEITLVVPRGCDRDSPG